MDDWPGSGWSGAPQVGHLRARIEASFAMIAFPLWS